jgi:hypothetical protein
MDEPRLVSRLMGLTISVAQAKKTFPGIPPGLFFDAAPPSDRGRLLTFGDAFRIAKRHAEAEALTNRQARAMAGRAAARDARKDAVSLPALDFVAEVIAHEVEALCVSLVARSAPPRAVQSISRIKGIGDRHADRARVRLAKKRGAHVPA